MASDNWWLPEWGQTPTYDYTPDPAASSAPSWDSEWSTPSYDSTPAPSFEPAYTPDYGAPSYNPISDSTLWGQGGGGGGGGGGGQSSAPATGTDWDSDWNAGQSTAPWAASTSWNSPTSWNQPAAGPSRSVGGGAGNSPIRLYEGSGPNANGGLTINQQGSGEFATESKGAGADVTGSFGVNTTKTNGPAKPPTLLERVNSGIDSAQDWTGKNPTLARLGLDAAGMLLGYKNQREARNLAREQLNMQRAAQSKNTAMADTLNSQARQSLNEARSLYNPQEMAIRSMAQQQMSTARNMNDARTQMQKAGKSKATIDAEMRRAKLAGTTGATTAFVKGLDTCRAAQQSALTAAKGLTQNYNATADYSGANALAKAGQADTDRLTSMLNTYLGNPVYQQEVEAMRRAQQNAYNNP
jgi:hypothetical protein